MKYDIEYFDNLNRLASKAQSGDKKSMDQVIQNLHPFISSFAVKYDRSRSDIFHDLYQEGAIAIMSAVRTYDGESGFPFFNHARTWVKRSIQNYFSENTRIVYLSKGKDVRKAHRNVHKFISSGKINSTKIVDIMSKELSVSKSSVEVALGYMHATEISSSMPMVSSNDSQDRSATLEDTLVGGESPESILENQQLSDIDNLRMKSMLSLLNNREKRIVEKRVLAEDEDKMTLELLSQELSISKERVRQIEKNAINKMTAVGLQMCA